jgi:transcriptional regulator with XRE-family HTH domain
MPPNLQPEGERELFSQRLRKILERAQYAPDSPTQLAREFNVRYDGKPVTVHAARKWLMGEAIPTQDKVRALSRWLGVTAEWLRFGGPENKAFDQNGGGQDGRIQPKFLTLIEDLERLDERHQKIVFSLVRQLVHIGA